VPHREPGGIAAATPGLPARAMLEARLKAYVLFGGVDPANDLGKSADRWPRPIWSSPPRRI